MNPARYIIRFLFTRLYVWVSRGGGTASLGMQVPELLPVVGDEKILHVTPVVRRVRQMESTYG